MKSRQTLWFVGVIAVVALVSLCLRGADLVSGPDPLGTTCAPASRPAEPSPEATAEVWGPMRTRLTWRTSTVGSPQLFEVGPSNGKIILSDKNVLGETVRVVVDPSEYEALLSLLQTRVRRAKQEPRTRVGYSGELHALSLCVDSREVETLSFAEPSGKGQEDLVLRLDGALLAWMRGERIRPQAGI